VGFVLNQVTDFAVNMLLKELSQVNTSAYQGGPVELESFHYIHKYSHISKASKISEGLYWSGDFDEIHEGLKDKSLLAENFKFFIGYSGWGPGQLEQELEEKSWLIGNINSSLLFDTSIADSDLWKHAIRSIGGSHSLLANSPIDPNLN
jgi:putative transcriptional regulator